MKSNINNIFYVCLLLVGAVIADDPAALYRRTIPEDKNLDPAWVESLTERGHVLDVGISGSKKDDTLKYIGMPVGGIACGTVYLNGDGRLYVWDLWSDGHIGVVQQTIPIPEGYPRWRKRNDVPVHGGANYMKPPTIDDFPPSFAQGFGIRFADGSLKKFEAADWDAVEFKGTWPIGTVIYNDTKSPVQAELKAYSPFIPLNLQDSSIPVTFMTYTLTNTSNEPVNAELVGWLENMSNQPEARKAGSLSSKSGLTVLSHDCAMQASMKREGTFDHSGTMALSYLGVGQETAVKQIPGIAASVVLKPGESREYTFLISWHFPVVRIKDSYKPQTIPHKNEYADRFEDATAVVEYVAEHFNRLSSQT